MMNRVLLIASLAASLAACGSTSSSTTNDLAVAPDLSVLPDLTPVPTITVTGHVVDLTKNMPIEGVKACSLPGGTNCNTTGADGAYTLKVPAAGQFAVQFSKDQFLTGIQESTAAGKDLTLDFILTDVGNAGLLAALLSADITKGIAAVTAVGLDGKGVAGVTFTFSPSTTAAQGPFYFNAGVPDKKAMSTDSAGRAIAVNLDSADYQVSAAVTGKVCGPFPDRAWAASQTAAKLTGVAGSLVSVIMICM